MIKINGLCSMCVGTQIAEEQKKLQNSTKRVMQGVALNEILIPFVPNIVYP